MNISLFSKFNSLVFPEFGEMFSGSAGLNFFMGRGHGSYIRVAHKEKTISFGACAYCGSKDKLCIDHIMPLSKGGDSSLTNLTLACNRCNSYKWDFTIHEFFSRIINKMEAAYMSAKSFIYRALKYKKRRPELHQKFSLKAIENYRMFKYFNKIRISLLFRRYLING